MTKFRLRFRHGVLAVSGVAALEIVGGVAAIAILLRRGEGVPGTAYPAWIFLILVLGYAAAATLLVLAGAADRRAGSLGATLFLVAALFGDRPLAWLAERWVAIAPLAKLQLSALLPYFLWRFAHDFPRAPLYGSTARLIRAASKTALGIGLLLLLANLVASDGGRLARLVGRYDDRSLYWDIVLVLGLAALAVILWRTRRAANTERRRVRLFVGALVLGSAPITLVILAVGLSERLAQWVIQPPGSLWAGLLVYSSLLSVPFVTAYSVLVNRVLNLRLVLRSAMQYALARYAILGWTALPFVALMVLAYRGRHQSLAALLGGPGSLILALIVVAGLVALRWRGRLLEALDRRFFRATYDARQILAVVTERARQVTTAREFSELVAGEVDRALHLESIAVLIADPVTGDYRATDAAVRPLGADSPLLELVGAAGGPLEIDLDQPRGELPESARYWIADGGFRLFIPLLSSARRLLGVLCLGEKRSELPFSREDRLLLRTIAAAGAGALESAYVASASAALTPGESDPVATAGLTLPAPWEAGPDRPASRSGAAECDSCGKLHPPGTGTCERCGSSTTSAGVPLVLAGKFRLLERLGSGGMGIVYKARDETLDRVVAIKVLPRVSPRASQRFRREARAMATFVHPNLALIFAAESWLGMPLLVVEYLAGGTLDARLQRGPLGEDETVDLGISLTEATACLHDAGMLHRDIKPSNIGFTAAGNPKLLDFGLAKVVHEAGDRIDEAEVDAGRLDDAEAATWSMVALSRDRHVVGTPLYMSPEAASGELPEPDFDLWSIAMTLYEAFAGGHPLAGGSARQVLEAVRTRPIPSVRERAPGCSAALAEFFDNALAVDRRNRLGDSQAFRARLLEARRALAMG